MVFFIAISVAVCEAKGVPFRDPLKPHDPDDDHAIRFPFVSVIDTIVYN
jgi:hypothetical protein